MAAPSNPSQLSKALREFGRIERTLFMIEWYSSLSLRRRCQAGLNKGEAAHKLKRAVFFHERGDIRDRSFDGQAFSSTESRFSQIRVALRFAILLIRLNGEWRRRWSLRHNRVKRVLQNMSIP
jgi:TnpA family transposase